jgi:hypothetical protein
MPYITKERRDEIGEELATKQRNWTPENAGDLNYLVTRFISNYLQEKGLKYANLNEMIGALECCKLELYRLIGAPYEDEKMDDNGPVYPSIEMLKRNSY